METKNRKESQIKKNSFLYFSLGLAGALVLSYAVLEMETVKEGMFSDFHQSSVGTLIDENYTVQPVVESQPVQKQQTTIIDKFIPIDNKTVDNDVEPVVDVKPIVQNTNQTNIVPSNTIVYVDNTPEPDVPFVLIEDVPIFPGCEKVSKENRRDCFQSKIQEHIRKNFHYPDKAVEGNIQGKVFISFIIEKDGKVSIANIRGPHKILENEANRIISSLPKMIPGKQRSKPVRMTMSIPITFEMKN